VLDAATQLQSSAMNVRLLIVGDGAELESLRGIADARRLANVRFTGLVPRTSIPSLLAASDVVLVTLRPSDVFKTVLPSKMFEAMAAARPIVLAVEGEARDTLLEAGAGIAIPPGSVRDLIDAIGTLAGDRELRAAMGASGMAFVQREYSRRAWAGRYLQLLVSVSRMSTEPVGSRQTAVTR
jgi:glycosyltransferase involved in cell wall biosynthesis